jgi:sulfoxide reductase heme-binding subunit YedZ
MGASYAGKALIAYTGAALIVMCAALLAVNGVGAEGWRVVIHATARTSVVLFTAAYVASSLRRLVRIEATKWLLANRRYVGLSYAASHTLHLAAIIGFARVSPDFEITAAALVLGGLAYVFLYLMALTSTDRAVAALGLANWRRLHRFGMHYNWFIFAQSYVPRVATEPGVHTVLAAVVLGGAALRVGAYARSRSA